MPHGVAVHHEACGKWVCIRVQKIVIKKANEFGEAEVWMNERLSRAAPHAIATFLTAYADGPPAPGTPLVLVWKFEGKLSLDDAMQARDFPANVEELLLGRKLRIEDPVMRKLATIKVRAPHRTPCSPTSSSS